MDRIEAIKAEVEAAGLEISGIESVNIHDAIKIGSPDREKYIKNYIDTLDNLGKAGIKVVCYNFMPVFDWTRTELAKPRPDGSTVLAYDQKTVDQIDPATFFDKTNAGSNGFVMPGWEPETSGPCQGAVQGLRRVDSDKLFENLVYFLKAIQPVCEKWGIKMAIHPDDPAWPVFGLPRIITNKENSTADEGCRRTVQRRDAMYRFLGHLAEERLPDIIRSLPGRYPFRPCAQPPAFLPRSVRRSRPPVQRRFVRHVRDRQGAV
jgi:mannonate dehydratase